MNTATARIVYTLKGSRENPTHFRVWIAYKGAGSWKSARGRRYSWHQYKSLDLQALVAVIERHTDAADWIAAHVPALLLQRLYSATLSPDDRPHGWQIVENVWHLFHEGLFQSDCGVRRNPGALYIPHTAELREDMRPRCLFCDIPF